MADQISLSDRLMNFAPARYNKWPIDDIRRDLTNSVWIKAKRNLLADFPWLKAFEKDIIVDEIVFETTKALWEEPPKYDAYQIESLASSISALLDRCLTYRRDMYALEELAAKRSLEYMLFTKQKDAQKAIELADYIQQQRKDEADGQNKAADKFADQKQAPLASGFEAVSRTIAASSTAAAAAEEDRKDNVNKKWIAAEEYQEALQARHSTPGHALNYGERLDRLTNFLKQDVGFAFQKLRCLSKACNLLFDLKMELEKPTEFGYLDYLVTFTRDLINQVEVATVEEIEFDHIVYLRQPRVNKPDGSTTAPYFTPQAWTDNFKTNKLFVFNLNTEFPTAIKKLRIRAIGLSFSTTAPENVARKLWSMSAVVFPPDAVDVFDAGSTKARPPVIFEGSGMTEPNFNRMVQSPAVANIDPRGKDWHLQLSTNVQYPDAEIHPRDENIVRDVKIHLRLAALVDKTPGNWSGFAA